LLLVPFRIQLFGIFVKFVTVYDKVLSNFRLEMAASGRFSSHPRLSKNLEAQVLLCCPSKYGIIAFGALFARTLTIRKGLSMSIQSGPEALNEYILRLGQKKAEKKPRMLLIQGLLAGLYIAIGAIASFRLSASIHVPGLGDFLGALVFPVGIIAVIVMQAELFTSNCMITTSTFAGEIKLAKVLKILGLVLLGNLLGSICAAFLAQVSGIMDSAAHIVVSKALHKVNIPPVKLFVSAVFCNIVVCTGVCLAYNLKDEMAKLTALWLAITVFVITGTEHVVANMYYLFAAVFAGAPLSAGDILYNLSVSGIGNFLGGGVVIAGINYIIAKNLGKEDVRKTQ